MQKLFHQIYSVQQTQFIAILKASQQNKRVNLISLQFMKRPLYIYCGNQHKTTFSDETDESNTDEITNVGFCCYFRYLVFRSVIRNNLEQGKHDNNREKINLLLLKIQILQNCIESAQILGVLLLVVAPMVSPLPVCLSVCISVGNLPEKLLTRFSQFFA